MTMRLNLKKPATSAAAETRAKSEFWLNVGYTVEVDTDEGVVERFVSLPFGIPLDTMKPLDVSGNSDAFAYLRMAQNDLLEALLEAANELKPGESRVLGAGDQLSIEIRRVKGERTDLKPGANPFARKLTF